MSKTELGHLVGSVESMQLDLRVVSSSSLLGEDIT